MPKDKSFKRVVLERFAQLQAQRDRAASLGSARDRAAHALARQVEHLRDAADAARAAGLSLTEIGRVLRVDPDLVRSWLLAESLDDGDPAAS